MRERMQDMLVRVRDVVMWAPSRARAAAVTVAVAVLVLGAVSVVVAGRVNMPQAVASTDQEVESCRAGGQAWVNALTAQTSGDRWQAGVAAWSTSRAARWLPTLDRSLIPSGPAVVTAEPARRGECVAWVEFADGTRWYASLVPDQARGVWVVDEWDDQS